MQTGEVGIEITPIIAARSLESRSPPARRAPAPHLRIARALTGPEQAALKLWAGEDSSQARTYFSWRAAAGLVGVSAPVYNPQARGCLRHCGTPRRASG